MDEKRPRIKHAEVWISIATNVCVVASVIFLAYEIQMNNSFLRRSEVNATMDQVSVFRMANLERDLAVLLVRARNDPDSLDEADRFRIANYYSQIFWTSWQIYDRERGGFVDEGEWGRAGRGLVLSILTTESGRRWWNEGRTSGMPPDFIALVNESYSNALAASSADENVVISDR